jgi:hypothetical protein
MTIDWSATVLDCRAEADASGGLALHSKPTLTWAVVTSYPRKSAA